MLFKAATSVLALAASALAQTAGFASMTSPSEGSTISSGSVFNIMWQTGSGPYSGPVKIELLGGSSPSTLEIKGILQSGVDYAAGSYAWSVESSLGSDATYGIKITLLSDPTIFQYSFPFKISGQADAPTAPLPTHPAPVIPPSKPTPTASDIPSTPDYVETEDCDDEDITDYTGDGPYECVDDEDDANYPAETAPNGDVFTGTIYHTISIAHSAKPAAQTPGPVPHGANYPGGAYGDLPIGQAPNNSTTLVYQPTRPALAPAGPASTGTPGVGSGSSASGSSPVTVSGASATSAGRLLLLCGGAMALFAL